MRDYAGISLAAVLIALTACSSTFRVAGIPTFGHIEDVSAADIRAAIVAYEKSAPGPHGPAEVISHYEIRIYQDRERRNYTAMLRVKGKWQEGSVVLRHPAY